jgi:hypothetical protein
LDRGWKPFEYMSGRLALPIIRLRPGAVKHHRERFSMPETKSPLT